MKRWSRSNRSIASISSMVLLAGFVAACQMPLAFQDPVTARESPAWQTQGRFHSGTANARASAPQAGPAWNQPNPAMTPAAPPAYPGNTALLDWSGGVVDGPAAGEITTIGGSPTHGLKPTIEGRNHIIALYQAVLDERDQLITEVNALQTALGSSQKQLEATRAASLERDTRITALEEGNRVLTEGNHALAARLTTAQIRRLEAEKLLLETQIAWHRARPSSGAGGEKVTQFDDGK